MRGRVHAPSGRAQLHVDDALGELARARHAALARGGGGGGGGGDDADRALADSCCLVGVTMVDLYSAESDLFVAGMAAGGSRVAVFSFHRYALAVAKSSLPPLPDSLRIGEPPSGTRRSCA